MAACSDACLTQPWLQTQSQRESRSMAESAKLPIHSQKQACFCKHLQHTAVALLRHVHKHSLEVHTQQGAAQVNPFSTPPHPTPTAACVPSLAGCQHDTPSPTAQKPTHWGRTDYTLCCPANRAPARYQQQCITAPPRDQCWCLVLVRRAAKAKAKARARILTLGQPGFERTPEKLQGTTIASSAIAAVHCQWHYKLR